MNRKNCDFEVSRPSLRRWLSAKSDKLKVRKFCNDILDDMSEKR